MFTETSVKSCLCFEMDVINIESNKRVLLLKLLIMKKKTQLGHRIQTGALNESTFFYLLF